ncbi:MAG: hypothetical protein M0Z66_12795 [Thermaerobacter sp.]|nr:hypothetical protein [Thermaerobacter sp.]
MNACRRVTAALLGGLMLSGCAAAATPPAVGMWHAVRGAPHDAMTTGIAAAGGQVYLAYATPGGRLLLQPKGHRPMALPGGDLAIAAPGTAQTPIAAIGASVYAATSDGVVAYVGGRNFGPVRQIRNGTPPVSLSACDGALCFDEIATFDPKSRTEVGPAALVRLTADGLHVGTFPDGLRPLPAPLVTAGGSLWLAAAPEPETAFYLLAAPERTLQLRIVHRFPQALKPIAMAGSGTVPTVLLLQARTGRLALWHPGQFMWVSLPSTARAATGAGVVTLGALPAGGGYLLGLPALPGNTAGILHQASLWRISALSGAGVRIGLPSAPRRFTAAPALATLRSSVLAAWQGHYAYFRWR